MDIAVLNMTEILRYRQNRPIWPGIRPLSRAIFDNGLKAWIIGGLN